MRKHQNLKDEYRICNILLLLIFFFLLMIFFLKIEYFIILNLYDILLGINYFQLQLMIIKV